LVIYYTSASFKVYIGAGGGAGRFTSLKLLGQGNSPPWAPHTGTPPFNLPGARQAFFNTKDTGSGLGAGTILGGCLGRPPVKDTGLGCTKAKRGWGDLTVGSRGTGDSARLQGDAEEVGWWAVITRPWLWLKVVAEAS
jgi:hypothetical protein